MERIREVLELIVCPVCYGQLSLQHSAPGETIMCNRCGRKYPIEDGIPILLESRASAPA